MSACVWCYILNCIYLYSPYLSPSLLSLTLCPQEWCLDTCCYRYCTDGQVWSAVKFQKWIFIAGWLNILKSHQWTTENILYSTLMYANLARSLQKTHMDTVSASLVSSTFPKSFWCLTSPDQHKHQNKYERKEWKRRKVLYLRSREANFSWRTIWTLWREERIKHSCVFTVSLQYTWSPKEMENNWCFAISVPPINCLIVYYVCSTLCTDWLGNVSIFMHQPQKFKQIHTIKMDFLPSCPLTPSLLLDHQALLLPETQESCHFTNRGHCNTARQMQDTVNKQHCIVWHQYPHVSQRQCKCYSTFKLHLSG